MNVTIIDEKDMTHIKVDGKWGLSFVIEPDRAMDIREMSYKGVHVSYDSPCDLKSPDSFEYVSGGFAENMFYGLLTTCGFENAGPEQCSETGMYWSQHGSLNNNRATVVEIKEDNDCLSVKGHIDGSRFDKYSFILDREIIFRDQLSEIEVVDKVFNPGEKDQICLMYHYNLGAPFLSKRCVLEIPYTDVSFKNRAAEERFADILRVNSASSKELPHVFYMSFKDNPEAFVVNDELGIKFSIWASGDTLPKMDLWKNLRPEKYVLSLEPCNALPYGRLLQQERGNACYLEQGESKIYRTKIKMEEI